MKWGKNRKKTADAAKGACVTLLVAGVVAVAAAFGPAVRGDEFNPEELKNATSWPAEGHSTADIVAASNNSTRHAIKLDLTAAIDLALSRNPTVQDFHEKVIEADALPGIAIAPSLPQLTLQGMADNQKDPLNYGNPQFGGEPYNNYQAGLKFDQSLFSGWSLWAGVKDAQYEKRLRTFDLQGGARDLSVQVMQAFYSVLLAQHMLASLERNLQVQDDLLKLTKHREVIGRSQLLDVLQIETQKAQLVPQIEQAKNQIRTNASTLALLLGERDATEFRLPDTLVEVDTGLLLDANKAPREPIPELEHAQMLRDQFEEKRTETLAPSYPALDLVGTWGRESYVKTDLFSQDSTNWSLGIQLSIPITGAAASVFERRQLASQAKQLEIEQAGTINTKSLAEVTAREALTLAQSNMVAYRDAYRIAGKSLAEARRTYRLAQIDYTQFLTTEAAYFTAEVSYEQSKYNTINAAAQYCVAAGIPLKYLYSILGESKS